MGSNPTGGTTGLHMKKLVVLIEVDVEDRVEQEYAPHFEEGVLKDMKQVLPCMDNFFTDRYYVRNMGIVHESKSILYNSCADSGSSNDGGDGDS